MDQGAWDRIYGDLENDLGGVRRRGDSNSELDVILLIDRVRFAMDKGDNGVAVALIDELRQKLRNGSGEAGATRGPGGMSTLERLESLEDRLHADSRLGSARLEIVGEDEEPPTRASSRNTKVNKSIKYDDIAAEFVTLFNAAEIRADKHDAVRREADRVLANRKLYERIEAETQVPWFFTGVIHGMECSFSLKKHLHNGDSLNARTWQVPAGRPKSGSPPFDFEESAIDALTYDGFAGKTDWPLAMILYRLERYNGWGYRRKFGTASPYLWSYCNHFTSGKYVKDGVYDPDALSKQCGAAVMLKDLEKRGLISFEAKKPEPEKPAVVVTAPPPKPPAPVAPEPTPAPAPVQAPAPAPAPPPTVVGVPATLPAQPAVTAPVAVAPPAPPAAPPPAPVVAPPPPHVPVSPPVAPAPAPVAAAPIPLPAAPLPSGVTPAVAQALAALAAAAKPASAETAGDQAATKATSAGAAGLSAVAAAAAAAAAAVVAKVEKPEEPKAPPPAKS